MKVAYLVNDFPKITHAYILTEIRAVKKQGIDIEVFALNDPGEGRVDHDFDLCGRITYLKKGSISQRVAAHLYWLKKNRRAYLRLARLAIVPGNQLGRMFLWRLHDAKCILERNPAHMHVYFGYESSTIAMLVSILTGIPYTFTTCRSDIYVWPQSNYPLKTALALAHITISNFNKRYLADKLRLPEGKIEVIRNGVDFDQVLPREAPEDGLVLTVARLEQEKGLDILIEAYRILKDEGISFKAQIVGGGRKRPLLGRLIEKYGLGAQVQLAGLKPHNAVYALLRKAALMALPSRSEGIPVVLMEAMAHKVPVIGAAVQGVPELIDDNVNGFLVPPDDPVILAAKIKALLQDSSLRRKLGEAGYRTVFEKFNQQIIAGQLIALWGQKGSNPQ